MENRKINSMIAGAILFARSAGITSLREIAQASLGPVSDRLWERVEDEWAWHNAQTSEDLGGVDSAALTPANRRTRQL